MPDSDKTSYHLSTYTISVKLEDTPDQILLIHGYTGAIDLAGSDLVAYLRTPGPLTPDDAPFSEDTWNVLVSRGYITNRSAEEEQAFVARMADAYHRRNKLFSTFAFIPSYDCNFRCPYCVEARMSGQGQEWSKKSFTKEMVDRAYETMTEIGPYPEFHVKQILLYGGEPLLKENLEIVRYIIQKGRALGYKFKAITNGYDLEEFRELLNPEMLYTLQITVDGNKAWHDQRRPHYRDGGSFDKIVRNIGLALEAGVGIAVRVNTDRNNFASLSELKALFTKLGYYRYDKLFSLHAGWLFPNETTEENTQVQAATESRDDNISYFSLKELDREIKDSGLKISCPSDSLYRDLYNAIYQKKLVNLNSTGCSSQSGAYVLDPQGDIYSCLEVVGQPDYALGHYSRSGSIQWRTEEIERWHSTNIATNPKCSKCKYALLCRGGCILKKLQDKRNGYSYCESFAEMFRTAANKAYQAYLNR